jgi:hypothetical protein
MKGTCLFMVVAPMLSVHTSHLGLRARSVCDHGHMICDWYRATVTSDMRLTKSVGTAHRECPLFGVKQTMGERDLALGERMRFVG